MWSFRKSLHKKPKQSRNQNPVSLNDTQIKGGRLKKDKKSFRSRRQRRREKEAKNVVFYNLEIIDFNVYSWFVIYKNWRGDIGGDRKGIKNTESWTFGAVIDGIVKYVC